MNAQLIPIMSAAASEDSLDSVHLPSVKGSPTVSEGKVVTPAFRPDGLDRAVYYSASATAAAANLAFAVAAIAYVVWIYFFLDHDCNAGGDGFDYTSAAVGVGLGALLRAPGVNLSRKEVVAIPKNRRQTAFSERDLTKLASRLMDLSNDEYSA